MGGRVVVGVAVVGSRQLADGSGDRRFVVCVVGGGLVVGVHVCAGGDHRRHRERQGREAGGDETDRPARVPTDQECACCEADGDGAHQRTCRVGELG